MKLLSFTSTVLYAVCLVNGVRVPRAIGFDCIGNALSPIRISEYIETDKFPDFIQTLAHDTEPSSIRVTKSDVGFFRVEPAYPNAKFWPMIIGGPLEYFYRLSHINIHWGESNTVGSEHIIGDIQYSMEIQAVYYNDKYGSLTEAIPKDDGLAIVSYLANVSDTPNTGLSRLVEQHNTLLPSGTRTALLTTKFAMSDLLKYFSDEYYTYKGSYSKRDYKPCAYNVQWIIRKEPISVSEGQINLFRTLALNSPALLNTFGEEEAINDRVVYYRVKNEDSVTCKCTTNAIPDF